MLLVMVLSVRGNIIVETFSITSVEKILFNLNHRILKSSLIGKTSLLISFAENKFPEDYVPTVFEVSSLNYQRLIFFFIRIFSKDYLPRWSLTRLFCDYRTTLLELHAMMALLFCCICGIQPVKRTTTD